MSLTKQDLKEIKNLIDDSAGEIRSEIHQAVDNSAKEIRSEIHQAVDNSAKEIRAEIREVVDNSVDETTRNLSDLIYSTKEQLLTTIGQEISDLADINRAVITRTDEIDHRLRIVERKLGLIVK